MNPLLAPLAAVYGGAASLRSAAYRQGWLKSRRLLRPVVSVGNLTTGGTGKTPLVALLARLLLERGLKPAILTRGYRRASGPSLIALDAAPERRVDPRQVGDEPAWLANELPGVPIVVSSDRYHAGCVAEERFAVDVHVLDDGFQHLRLCRNADIVTIDATQPLSDRAILPAGRQRERTAALKRAHFVILTRTDQADAGPLEALVHEINPRALVFRVRTGLSGWREVATGRRLAADFLQGRALYAFCGIGNPQAFFRDLKRWGFDVCGTKTFSDHHLYSEADLKRLVSCARQSDATLVTTEKDVMNLRGDFARGLEAYACRIEPGIEDSVAFVEALLAML